MFDFFKSKKYKKEVEELKSKLEEAKLAEEELKFKLERSKLTQEELKSKLVMLKLTQEELKYLDVKEQLYSLEKNKSELTTSVYNLKEEIKSLRKTVINLKEEQKLQSYGFYEPKYGFESSQAYKVRLDNVRGEQKELIRRKIATDHSTDYLVDGDKKKGKEFILDTIKLSLRAFNNECDNIISNAKYNNVEKCADRINKIFKEINSLTDMQKVFIKDYYLKLKIEELYLKYEYECKKQEEKEEQQAIKERMKEEAKVLKEIELAKKKVEKEETHFKNAINDLNNKIESSSDDEKDKLLKKLAELESKLKEVELSKEDVINKEKNTRAGYVYVISNLGSFGEDVYKIGMTRRLNPTDRVKELGSASVPFNFDIHAMIFAEDAPELENKLHKRFASNQVNKVNPRKEFFKVSLSEIEDVVNKEFDKPVEFTKLAEAEEYRKSIALNKQHMVSEEVI